MDNHCCVCNIQQRTLVQADGDDLTYCESCYMQRYIRCTNCRIELPSDSLGEDGRATDIVRHNLAGEPICDVCAQGNKTGTVHSYYYKPAPLFHGTDSKLYMGIELEIENPGPCNVRKISKDESDIYCKHDGSIDNGFELVWHPMTYRYIINHRDDIEAALNYLADHQCYPENTCGMHIHMSKDAFTALQMYRYMWFIYHNKRLITKVGARNAPLAWCTCDLDDYEDEEIVRYAKRKTTNGNKDRHTAFNLNPPHTAELRIFASTLDIDRYMVNVQFARALYRFVVRVKKSNLTDQKFIDYIDSAGIYPELSSYLA